MLFISSDIYIDAISLLTNDANTTRTHAIVTDLVSIYTKDYKINHSIQNQLSRFCVSVLQEILKHNITFDRRGDLLPFLLKYKNNPKLAEDSLSYDMLVSIITKEKRLQKPKIEELYTKIKHSTIWYNISLLSRELMELVNRSGMQTLVERQQEFFELIKEKTNEISAVFNRTNELDPAVGAALVERIVFSDKESIKRGFVKHNQLRKHGYPTGLKGFNRMFGATGGPTRGESIVLNALMHMYKTGLLLSFARWLVKYGPRPTEDTTRKPLILFVSLENEADQNLVQLFKDAYEALYQTSADGLSIDQMIDYVYEYFNANGYELIIERVLPDQFGYDEMVKLIEHYESEGFEIISLIIDYMNNMKKESSYSKNDRPDLMLRRLYSLSCNQCKNKNIILVTAHQLNRGAAEIASSGVTNIVRRFDSNHLSDGMDPQREVDMVVYIHVERKDGESYLTMNCKKHRYVHDTPAKDLYTAYRFSQFGIVDDLELDEDFSTVDIYSSKKNKKIDGEVTSLDELF